MTNTGADMRTITLEKGLATFLNALSGKNRSAATIRAYQTDIAQFISFLHANNVSIHTPAEVEKIDVVEYLSSLARKELTGIARARKMSVAPQLTVVTSTIVRSGVAVLVTDAHAASVVPREVAGHETTAVRAASSNDL